MTGFENETASWLSGRLEEHAEVELELGSLIAAASSWTEDETELGDLVDGLVEAGCIQLAIG